MSRATSGICGKVLSIAVTLTMLFSTVFVFNPTAMAAPEALDEVSSPPIPPFLIWGTAYGPDGAPIQKGSITITNLMTGESLNADIYSNGAYEIELEQLQYGYSVGDEIEINALAEDRTTSQSIIVKQRGFGERVDIYFGDSKNSFTSIPGLTSTSPIRENSVPQDGALDSHNIQISDSLPSENPNTIYIDSPALASEESTPEISLTDIRCPPYFRLAFTDKENNIRMSLKNDGIERRTVIVDLYHVEPDGITERFLRAVHFGTILPGQTKTQDSWNNCASMWTPTQRGRNWIRGEIYIKDFSTERTLVNEFKESINVVPGQRPILNLGATTITEPTIWRNLTVIINGDAVINAPLDIIDSDVFGDDFYINDKKTISAGSKVDLQCPEDGKYKVQVNASGILEIYGNLTNNPDTAHYWFYMNGTLLLTKSPLPTAKPGIVENVMGSPDLSQPGGIICTTNNVQIKNGAEVRYGKTHGVWLEGSNAVIQNAKIHDNGGDGIVCIAKSNPSITGTSTSVSWNKFNGIYVNNALPLIDGITVAYNSADGIVINNSYNYGSKYCGIYNSSICDNHASGISLNATDVIIQNNSILRNGNELIFRDDMSPISISRKEGDSITSSSGTQITTRQITSEEIIQLKEIEGVYQEGVNYTKMVDGFMTGIIPRTEAEWDELASTLLVIEDIVSPRSLPDFIDHSESKYFPPVGNQQGTLSCASWANIYYTRTFREALEAGWDLSNATWNNLLMEPDVEFQNMIMSPYFQFNTASSPINIGISTWSTFSATVGGVVNTSLWPPESAWREAPMYRCKAQSKLTYENNLTDLKSWIYDGNLVPIYVNSTEYNKWWSHPLRMWTNDTYDGKIIDHYNTIVGYDDNYGPYNETDENGTMVQKYGAVKVVNSWGSLYDFYWISYNALMKKIKPSYVFLNNEGYEPSLLAVFNVTHPSRVDSSITIRTSGGLGKEFPHVGDYPYPNSKMVLDISEISYRNGDQLTMEFSGGDFNGTINEFSVEHFIEYYPDTDGPRRVITSADPPVAYNSSDMKTVYAHLYLNTMWNTSGLWHLVHREPDAPIWNLSHRDDWCYWFGNDDTGNYDMGIINGTLATPMEITLQKAREYAFLTFWEWHETDTTGLETDQRWIIIHNNDRRMEIQLSGDPMNSWTRYVLNISLFIPSSIFVEFKFDSITSDMNAYQGWYIDDIEIIADTLNVRGDGLCINGATNSTVTNNTIKYNNWNGIYISKANGTVIADNQIHYNDINGIYIEVSNNIIIQHNDVSNHDWNGIYLYLSDCSELSDNNVSSHGSSGILIEQSNNNRIVMNQVDFNVYDGILLWDSDENQVNNNTAHENYFGIEITYLSSFNFIRGNHAYENIIGILIQSDSNTIENNTVYDNDGGGFYILYSMDLTLHDNIMVNDGIAMEGDLLADWNTHSISTSNTVNGKPVYYYKNSADISVPPDSGQVIFANCQNMRVANQNLSNGSQAVSIAFSSNIIVTNNVIQFNDEYGIFMESSDNNQISYNQISASSQAAINIYSSNDNTIRCNNLSNNFCGMYFWKSERNLIYFNTFFNNIQQAEEDLVNYWNNGYPSGGNYWSDYVGTDAFSGKYQDINGSDGIGDLPYTGIINWMRESKDRYPLLSIPSFSTYSIPLNLGWNLLSFPPASIETTIPEVLSSIDGQWDRVMWYDSTDYMDPWKTYRVDGTANDLFYLDHTMGFWLYVTDAGDGFLTVEGRVPTATSVQLYTGWNLVGYPSLTSRTLTDALAGTSADVISVFDPASTSMLRDIVLPSDELMVAGSGYYVRVTADCVWTIDW